MKKISIKDKKILITAGPTWVPIDKVRVITNIFSGKLGWIIAKEAAKRGAKVTLLLGPGAISLPSKISSFKIIRFKFFDELFKLMKKEISSKKYDIVIHSAAVSDFKPDKVYQGKISSSRKKLILTLLPTLKIVDQIKKWDPKIFLVKFKVEDNLPKEKLIEKSFESMLFSNAELMVANNLSGISKDKHHAFIIDRDKNIIKCETKEEIAKKLLKKIEELFQKREK